MKVVNLDEKKVLEKWLKQIKSDEISPEFIGLGLDKQEAINKLNKQIAEIQKGNYKSKKFV